jgi:hypothetical protein
MWLHNRNFKVKTVSRAQVTYLEAGRTMNISIEPAYDGVIVYTASICTWEPPDESVPVSEGDRKRILQNLKSVLAPRWAFWMKVHLYPDDEIQQGSPSNLF